MTTVEADRDALDVAWDIETLLPEPGDAGIDALLDRAESRATELETKRGTVVSMTSAELAGLMHGLAEIGELVGRAGNYVQLAFSVDTDNPANGARMMKVEERATAINTRLLWFELEWAELDDDAAEALLADPALEFAAYHLRSQRRYRPHLLSEPEEVILNEKSVTGASAWVRLFEELISAITLDIGGETVKLEAGLSRLQSPNRDERRSAADAITAGLAPGLRTRAYVFNTLLADKSIDDRMRHFPGWLSSRNLANEASDESVAALVEAVQGRYAIPQQWYALKAKLLGIDRLADYDRMATVAESESTIGWDEARSLVLDAYALFSPRLADAATEFFDGNWIDAPVRPAKRPGAFCAYTVPSHHPYLFLNWTSRRRDVLTLAHEMGHGLHAYLALAAGRVPPVDAVDARRDRIGVR